MATFSWARPKPLQIEHRLTADRRIYFISDLHLGDGTRSDTFMGKDQELLGLLQRVRDEDAMLVIVGDAVDFQQAWSMTRVLKAHAKLFGELSRLADSHGVIYIWGNHDYDIAVFKDVLRFTVCSSLYIGDKALVQHGYEYDPFIGPDLDQGRVVTMCHHMFERLLDTWFRLPIQHFYTIPNRILYWLAHKGWLFVEARKRLYDLLGSPLPYDDGISFFSRYWSHAEMGDPQHIFEDVKQTLLNGPHSWLVTGHSHLPGLVKLGEDRTYVNTGSWTFRSSQYALWDGDTFTVRDWITGRVYDDHHYKPLMDRRFRHLDTGDWWKDNYLGWLRFRIPEEIREDAQRTSKSL